MKNKLRTAASSLALSVAGLLATAGMANAVTFNITWTSDQGTAVGGASFTGTVNSQMPATPVIDLYPNDRSLVPPVASRRP